MGFFFSFSLGITSHCRKSQRHWRSQRRATVGRRWHLVFNYCRRWRTNKQQAGKTKKKKSIFSSHIGLVNVCAHAQRSHYVLLLSALFSRDVVSSHGIESEIAHHSQSTLSGHYYSDFFFIPIFFFLSFVIARSVSVSSLDDAHVVVLFRAILFSLLLSVHRAFVTVRQCDCICVGRESERAEKLTHTHTHTYKNESKPLLVIACTI